MALAADIESREWRRKYLESNGLPEEHPRASNTDDIECFFSILCESVGKDFTLKEVYYYARTMLLFLLTTGVEKGYWRIYEAP